MTDTSKTIIETISELIEHENNLRKIGNNAKEYAQINRLFWELIALPAGLSILIAIVGHYGDQPWLYTTSIAALGLSYIGFVLYVIASTWLTRREIKKIFQNPLMPQLKIAATAINADQAFLPVLQKFPHLDLQIAQLEIKAERESLEKRTGIVLGALDKVGIAPGLLTTIIAYQKIKTTTTVALNEQPLDNQIILALTIALPFLYLMGVVAHTSMSKLDRIIKIIELTITRKNAKKLYQTRIR